MKPNTIIMHLIIACIIMITSLLVHEIVTKLLTHYPNGLSMLRTDGNMPDPTASGQSYVGPDAHGLPVTDMDFVSCGGRFVYLHIFIEDLFAHIREEDMLAPRPTDDTECFLTLSINGTPFLDRMALNDLPTGTNIDLQQAIRNVDTLRPLDVFSVTITGGENMYLGVGVGYGIL
jgi:hypothetical protein